MDQVAAGDKTKFTVFVLEETTGRSSLTDDSLSGSISCCAIVLQYQTERQTHYKCWLKFVSDV